MAAAKLGRALTALSLILLLAGCGAETPGEAKSEPQIEEGASQDLNALARDVGRVESLRQVKDVQRRYAQYQQYGLWNDMAALFSDGAVIQWGDAEIKGRGAILDWLEGRGAEVGGLGPGALNTEFIDEPLVNLAVDGESAEARWMSLAFKGDGEGKAWIEGGLYENDYVREGGLWKIAVMRYYPQYEGGYAIGGAPDTPHVFIDASEERQKALGFVRYLIFPAKDVRVVLCHLAHPHQSMQRAMSFVAVTAAKLRHPDRQVAIGFDALFKYLNMRRTVHGLQRHEVRLAGEHRRLILR